MGEVGFLVNPKHLSAVLGNAVTIMRERIAKDAPTHALIRYEYDQETGKGQVCAVGVGRWAAGLDWCEVEGGPDTYAEVMVLASNPVKTDIVDDLAKLATAVRGTSTAQSALVRVTMVDGYLLGVTFGDEFLGELAHTSVARAPFNRAENMIDLLEESPVKHTPTLFHQDVIGRLAHIKAAGRSQDWGMIDMAQHPDLPIAGIKIGPTFRALLGAVDRAQYAATGPEQQSVLF
jgi:hypothetical protein